MEVAIRYGLETTQFEVVNDQLIAAIPTLPNPIKDFQKAISNAMENPFQYPPLRQALTPDDKVVVVVDESLPHVGQLLVPILEHITSAAVRPEAITLVFPTASAQEWIEDLPDELQEVRMEVHDPRDRKRLTYLATTRGGRRIYLNRSVGEADQVVVLGRRRFDGWHGLAGAGGDIYPVLSDEATREELSKTWNDQIPGVNLWPLQQETEEVLWLLGMPYFIQIIDGPCDTIAEVIAGTSQARSEGDKKLLSHWRREVDQPAALVIASISGDPEKQTFADFAAAVTNAMRVVQPDGRIVLLTEARPILDSHLNPIRQADNPEEALKHLQKLPIRPEMIPALLWSRAIEHARISVLSRLEGETIEDLFAAPLPDADLAQRWIEHSDSILVLEDAHKTLAVLKS